MALQDNPVFLAYIPELYISGHEMIPVGEEKFPTLEYLCDEIGCSERLARLTQRLHTPEEMLDFIKYEVTVKRYNRGDDLSVEEITQQLTGNCSDMAKFISFVGKLNGYEPRLVSVVSDRTDPHHNWVIWRSWENSKLGVLGMSKHNSLLGKGAQFSTVREAVESYFNVFTCDDEKNYPGRLTMLAFSRPTDLVARYGYEPFLTRRGINQIEDDYWKNIKYAYTVSQRRHDLPEIITVPPDGGNIVVNGIEI